MKTCKFCDKEMTATDTQRYCRVCWRGYLKKRREIRRSEKRLADVAELRRIYGISETLDFPLYPEWTLR